MTCIVGIRHRVKATAEGEARPTQVVLLYDAAPDQIISYDLATEQDELDFLLGRFPVTWRKLEDGEKIGNDVPDSHLKHKKSKNDAIERQNAFYRVIDGEERVVTHMAVGFDGLQSGNRVAMLLGGSGDYFAFALARRAEEIGATVFRIPAAAFKELRGEAAKDNDASALAEALLNQPESFYEFRSRDAEMIRVREAYFARIDAMKARIACEQRLRQRFIGSIFCSPDGQFPEGAIEKAYDQARANDAIYQALLKEERGRENELKKLVESSMLWSHILKDVTGCGWAIVSRIIASVVDIRRFHNKHAFKKFAGVHVLEDGAFPRQRRGVVANWQPDFRQALYLLGDQMNRRPDSYWGRKLMQNKQHFRQVHPEEVIVDGKKRYTNGHIHKMAVWRTLTQFTIWLFREWKRLERNPERFALRSEYPLAQEEPKQAAA